MLVAPHPDPAGRPELEAYAPRSRAWTLVAILFFAGVVSAIDRGVLNMVVDPVRQELRISDLQIGLLQGLSFSLFYATAALPLGLVADRTQRVRLLALGVTVWSAAIILGGFATSFGWMFASRVLIGLGEATLAPCALSLISDLFPSHRRGAPISLQLMGSAVAAGLGALLVGFIFAQARAGLFDGLPMIGRAAPWRIVFIACGCLGFLLAGLLLTQREPQRRGRTLVEGQAPGPGRTLRHLGANRRIYLPFYAAFALFTVAAWAFNSWTPTLLMRDYDLSHTQVAAIFGLPSILAGAGGALLGGQILDRRRGRWTHLARARLLILIPLTGLPATLAAFAPNIPVATGLLLVMTVLFPMATTVMMSSLSDMVPSHMRAFSVALLGLCSSAIGAVAGPLLVGFATDSLFGDPKLVGYSLIIVGGPALLLASGCYWLTAHALRGDQRLGGGLEPIG